MDDRKITMGIAFVGVAFGISGTLREPGFLGLPLWRATLKLLLAIPSYVLFCWLLCWIGYAAESHFIGEEDSKMAKILKRAGILVIWTLISSLTVSYALS